MTDAYSPAMFYCKPFELFKLEVYEGFILNIIRPFKRECRDALLGKCCIQIRDKHLEIIVLVIQAVPDKSVTDGGQGIVGEGGFAVSGPGDHCYQLFLPDIPKEICQPFAVKDVMPPGGGKF